MRSPLSSRKPKERNTAARWERPETCSPHFLTKTTPTQWLTERVTSAPSLAFVSWLRFLHLFFLLSCILRFLFVEMIVNRWSASSWLFSRPRILFSISDVAHNYKWKWRINKNLVGKEPPPSHWSSGRRVGRRSSANVVLVLFLLLFFSPYNRRSSY